MSYKKLPPATHPRYGCRSLHLALVASPSELSMKASCNPPAFTPPQAFSLAGPGSRSLSRSLSGLWVNPLPRDLSQIRGRHLFRLLVGPRCPQPRQRARP